MYKPLKLAGKRKLSSEERRKIYETLRHRTTPDDVIASVFSYVKKERITADYGNIHSAIYKLKKDYPKLLEEFTFSKNDIYPFSKLLERVFFRLQNGGLISTVNPDFKKCIIDRKSKKYIHEKILNKFSVDQRKEIEKMGNKFFLLVK